MRSLRRFARLPGADKFLLLRALFVVSVTRVGLWLLPIGALRRIVLRTGRKTRVAPPVTGLVWAVKIVSRYVPVATCLTQALALQWLLMRSGHASRVCLGARKDPEGKFEAHAWVECEGRVVIGGAEAHEYAPLTSWKGSL
jgi:hypothetical protein